MNGLVLGATAALTGAAGWSIAAHIYGRVGSRFSAIFLNMFKNLFSLALLVPAALLLGESLDGIGLRQFLLVFVSGVLGIGIGDSAYIAAVTRLGARRVLVAGTITPIVTSLMAFLLLGEQLRWQQGVSLLIILAGIATVLSEKSVLNGANSGNDVTKSASLRSGFLYLALSIGTYSLGTVVSRGVFVDNPVSALWTSIIRLGAGGVITIISLTALRIFLNSKSSESAGHNSNGVASRGRTWSCRDLTHLVVAALLGTVLGLWMQQTAIKFAPAAIAQTLLCTSPIFALPISKLAGETLTARGIIGALVATLGTVSLVLQ
jgi:drug/metabolite transporter (DMT)-like permease